MRLSSPDKRELKNKETTLQHAFDSMSKDLSTDSIMLAKQQLEEANKVIQAQKIRIRGMTK